MSNAPIANQVQLVSKGLLHGPGNLQRWDRLTSLTDWLEELEGAAA